MPARSELIADLHGKRQAIKAIGGTVDALRRGGSPCDGDGAAADGEYLANVTLAYRHLEDAAMRLGKAVQALDGGVSVYDRDAASHAAQV